MEENYIKTIFGLKLKQIRNEKGFSLSYLSKISGLSKSYVNEIENGKKYPKKDKIILLADALGTSYDEMVSLKLDKNLAPIADILQSKILNELPLNLFGIEERDLIEIIADAPAKVNAFISTIIEIGNNYNLTRENFFQAALRSYQEAHDNYFEEIELKVDAFNLDYRNKEKNAPTVDFLKNILITEFNYTIEIKNFNELDVNLSKLRSIFVPKTNTLLINIDTDNSQQLFILAKEVGYQYLGYKDRLYSFSWAKYDSFEQILNNFYASYFSGALLIPREKLVMELTSFFNQNTWDSEYFKQMVARFTDSPETFYQRMTNVLPKYFNIKNIFFIRLTNKKGSEKIDLTKELHIQHQHSPNANKTSEHYCRKWVSVKVLKKVATTTVKHLVDCQISTYPMHENAKYWVISSATPDPFEQGYYRSISIGILMKNLSKKIDFLTDDTIGKYDVGVTCENCAIENCSLRAAEASRYNNDKKNESIQKAIELIVNVK